LVGNTIQGLADVIESSPVTIPGDPARWHVFFAKRDNSDFAVTEELEYTVFAICVTATP